MDACERCGKSAGRIQCPCKKFGYCSDECFKRTTTHKCSRTFYAVYIAVAQQMSAILDAVTDDEDLYKAAVEFNNEVLKRINLNAPN